MTALSATVNAARATSIVVRIPWAGAWIADVVFDSALAASALVGLADVTIGSLTLRGTFAPLRTGTFQIQSRARIVGGAGLWGTILKAKAYHSDAGVKVATIVADAAREAGETLGANVDSTVRAGVDFERMAGPARDTIEQALRGTPWWIDGEGTTQIGERAQVEVTAAHEVLDYDPRSKVATVSTDEPGSIIPGSVLRSRLAVPLLVREVTITAKGGAVRLSCWGEELAA